MTTIVLTTDLLDHDHAAFEHSVGLALGSGASLVALHANGSPQDATRMPDAQAVLRRWDRPAGSLHYQTQVHSCCDDVIDTVLDGLRRLEPDLVVATTHDRGILARTFGGSGAESIAHNVTAPVLLFPPEIDRGFVAPADGASSLRSIVVPAGDAEAARAGLLRAGWIAELLDASEVEVLLLCVGDHDPIPDFDLEVDARLKVRKQVVDADDVCTAIVEHSRDASLVVMATRGHDSLGDVLRGSRTDRVLHRVGCPVLSVKI
ncbi:MAG: universal stress protein [Nannocystaceae bacterium]